MKAVALLVSVAVSGVLLAGHLPSDEPAPPARSSSTKPNPGLKTSIAAERKPDGNSGEGEKP